jgi:hypothetical protein
MTSTFGLADNIYLIPSISDPFTYYRPDLSFHDLKNTIPIEKTITVIPYASEIHGLDYKNILSTAGYHQDIEKSFRGLSYQRWSK